MPHNIAAAVTSDFTMKALGTFFITAIAPHFAIVIIMLAFLGTDFLTGMYASKKNKEIIVSHRLKKTIEKFVFYSVAIFAGIFFESIFMPGFPLTKIVGGFICSIELLSIYENVKKITGLDIATKVRQYLSSFLKKK